MQSYKSVALRLHSLHEDDQRWLLSRLSADDQSAIELLLGELKDLGIPRLSMRDLETGERLEVQVDPLTEEADPLPSVFDVVDQADVSQIVKFAESEPVEVMGVVVSLADWRWKDCFLATRTESDRLVIEAAENDLSGRVNESMRALILSHAATRISGIPVSVSNTGTDQQGLDSSNRSILKSIFCAVRRGAWQR